MTTDEQWMAQAILQAKKALSLGEVPVGAVLVKDDKMVAQAHNKCIKLNDACAHAEIECLRLAGKVMQNYRIPNSTLYVTLEPCVMCFAALINARISKVVFASYDKKTGACGSAIDLKNAKCFNHKMTFIGGVLEQESSKIITDFFKSKR